MPLTLYKKVGVYLIESFPTLLTEPDERFE